MFQPTCERDVLLLLGGFVCMPLASLLKFETLCTRSADGRIGKVANEVQGLHRRLTAGRPRGPARQMTWFSGSGRQSRD